MNAFVFETPAVRSIPVAGMEGMVPIHRIFCVGRNYAAHAAEMGNEVDREAPFYFTKSALSAAASGQTIAYPPGTENYHYEMEFVVALGAPAFRVDPSSAGKVVFGYGCGLDMTRRDLQQIAKDNKRPWDLAKDGENSAVFGALTPAAKFGAIGAQRIVLSVNGEARQDATLDEMIHSVPEIIADLSKYYHLGPGDIIMTGTPAGVGAVRPGDRLEGYVDGLEPVILTIGPGE